MDNSTEKSKSLNRFYTYLYRDQYGVPIYVGKGCAYRAWQHLTYKNSNRRLSNKLKKMIQSGYNPQPEIICNDVDEEFALFVEQEAIAKYGRKDLGTGTLYNLTDGGEGLSGRVFSDEHKQNLSKARQGRITSDETREKMSKSQKGHFTSDETRKKISISNTGHVISVETRRKISISKTKKKSK